MLHDQLGKRNGEIHRAPGDEIDVFDCSVCFVFKSFADFKAGKAGELLIVEIPEFSIDGGGGADSA